MRHCDASNAVAFGDCAHARVDFSIRHGRHDQLSLCRESAAAPLDRSRWQFREHQKPEAARNAEAAARLKLTAEQVQGIKDEVARIDDLLARPPLDVINSKFEATKNAKHCYDLEWYKVYAAPAYFSIRSISDAINRAEEYAYLYSPFSRFTHGSDMWKSITIGEQNLQTHPIREPQSIPQVIQLPATLALRVFRMVIQHYRAGEEENFKRKYLQEWRARFRKTYIVELVPQELMI